MSEEAFLKCACSYCQGHIEFPAHALGITTTCPHCGVETTLVSSDAVPAAPAPPPPPPPPAAKPALASAPKPPPPPPPPPATPAPPALDLGDTTPVAKATTGAKLKQVLTVVWSVLVGLSVLGFFGLKAWRWYRNTERVVVAAKGEPKPDEPKTTSVPSTAPPKPAPKPAPMPVAVPTSVIVAKGTPPPRKAGDDLQVLNFDVHKAKDGNLQYVVGVVTNHSAKQLFNVKLEFELTRTDGKTGDIATDSIRNLGPNAGGAFKANIIGNAPVASAKLAKLEGEKE